MPLEVEKDAWVLLVCREQRKVITPLSYIGFRDDASRPLQMTSMWFRDDQHVGRDQLGRGIFVGRQIFIRKCVGDFHKQDNN